MPVATKLIQTVSLIIMARSFLKKNINSDSCMQIQAQLELYHCAECETLI